MMRLCGVWALRAGWTHAQVHHALDMAHGGNPSASLDEVVAKLARARVHAHLHLLSILDVVFCLD